ncbi:BnaC08g19590D [Brassica napus]|uniref:BnaC08g19590D protein n=1 Tax=Brassica napus TaxID=3708 RepID=A0A078H844_BRANA|nr:AT-rich interactive domain-containing protein 6 isoform X1 [Brassica napus]XP_022569715.1 AT-rich interactive domain-containing protein 6 isoform X1 [Brassica napus]CDY33659.1 BnaC08g19590D [Brassica napus]
MEDTEMQLGDVPPCVATDDDDVLKEEPSEPENNLNTSETPQPILPVDKGDENGHEDVGVSLHSENKTDAKVQVSSPKAGDGNGKKRKNWLLSDSEAGEVDEAGTLEEQQAFLKELATFHRENYLDYKPLKFYGQPLNTLKLWRAVVKLGGHDVVTTSKLWRQVGESFNPPKTCTTISYTFRNFYEKALLEYEKSLRKNGELNFPNSTHSLSSGLEKEVISHQGSGSGRARRDSAARAMQGWHTQRLVGSGEDKGLSSTPKHKKLKSIGFHKPKTQTCMDHVMSQEAEKQSIADVVDDGPLADWVKITVKETKESFEIYALVPGLLRKEIRIQSDPAGRLIITGEPEQLDNPWGITPFKKIVGLSARIDPLHTSAVMSMHGRLFIRVPFAQ